MATTTSVLIILTVLFCENVLPQHEERQLQTWSSNCSYWSHYNRETNTCDCGSNLYNIVYCETKVGAKTEVNVSVSYGYCMTLSNDRNEAVVGACPYHYLYCTPPCTHVPVSRYIISTDFCRNYKRTSQLCGQCMDGYSPPVYSYYAECVRCRQGTNNWTKYLAVSLLPTTAFLLALTIIRFRATSPQITGYIFMCQVVISPIVLRIIVYSPQTNNKHFSPTGDLYFAVLSMWNLDFFRLFYSPFCLHPNATTLQVLSL